MKIPPKWQPKWQEDLVIAYQITLGSYKATKLSLFFTTWNSKKLEKYVRFLRLIKYQVDILSTITMIKSWFLALHPFKILKMIKANHYWRWFSMTNQRISQVNFMEKLKPPSSSSVMEILPSQFHIPNKCNITKMHRITIIDK